MQIQHYKDSAGAIYGFAADGSQDHLKPEGLVEVTATEAVIQGRLNYENSRAKEIAALDYVRQRIAHYPEIGEFLDAWVKNDQEALEEYRQKCLAIKAQFPKPEGF